MEQWSASSGARLTSVPQICPQHHPDHLILNHHWRMVRGSMPAHSRQLRPDRRLPFGFDSGHNNYYADRYSSVDAQ